MNIALYVIAAFGALSVLVVIGSIGKPRKPMTPGAAVAVTLIWAVIVTVLIIAARRLS